MSITYNFVKTEVHHKVKSATVSAMIKNAQLVNPHLWSVNKHRFFLRYTIFIQLYKDITGIGYTRLLSQIHGWYKVNVKSLQHNIKVI